MSERSIEEVYKSIAPPRNRGVVPAPVFAESFSGSNGELTASLSNAAAEIAQLRSAWQAQAALITANTQAVQGNTSAQGHSVASTAGHVASSLFGGALGFLSPIATSLSRLFGGGSSQPAQLPFYTAPAPVAIDATLRTPVASAATPPAAGTNTTTTNQTSYSPQITVNVNAMDSQSFMDRSGDIASAVREAMLNNHPINGVVADL